MRPGNNPGLPGVYLITDGTASADTGAFLERIEAALSGGARLVQLREKGLPAKDLLRLAREVRALASGYGARLLINDRTDIARLCGADGVHLTARSYPASSARRLLRDGSVIGVSTHSITEARLAEAEGADFVTFGPVFHTPSKAGHGDPAGAGGLEKTVRALSIPVYALGGINRETIAVALDTGAYAALVSAIMASPDAEAAAAELVRKADARRNTHKELK